MQPCVSLNLHCVLQASSSAPSSCLTHRGSSSGASKWWPCLCSVPAGSPHPNKAQNPAARFPSTSSAASHSVPSPCGSSSGASKRRPRTFLASSLLAHRQLAGRIIRKRSSSHAFRTSAAFQATLALLQPREPGLLLQALFTIHARRRLLRQRLQQHLQQQ